MSDPVPAEPPVGQSPAPAPPAARRPNRLTHAQARPLYDWLERMRAAIAASTWTAAEIAAAASADLKFPLTGSNVRSAARGLDPPLAMPRRVPASAAVPDGTGSVEGRLAALETEMAAVKAALRRAGW